MTHAMSKLATTYLGITEVSRYFWYDSSAAVLLHRWIGIRQLNVRLLFPAITGQLCITIYFTRGHMVSHHCMIFADSSSIVCYALEYYFSVNDVTTQARKGFWQELLDIGDFYYDLGVHILQMGLIARERYGGTIYMDDLIRQITRVRGESSDAISE